VPRGVSRVGTTPPLLARQREPRTQRKRSKWPPLRRLLRYASCAAQEKLSCAAQEKLPLTPLRFVRGSESQPPLRCLLRFASCAAQEKLPFTSLRCVRGSESQQG